MSRRRALFAFVEISNLPNQVPSGNLFYGYEDFFGKNRNRFPHSFSNFISPGEVEERANPTVPTIALEIYQDTAQLMRHILEQGLRDAPSDRSQECRSRILSMQMLAFLNYRIYDTIMRDKTTASVHFSSALSPLRFPQNSLPCPL